MPISSTLMSALARVVVVRVRPSGNRARQHPTPTGCSVMRSPGASVAMRMSRKPARPTCVRLLKLPSVRVDHPGYAIRRAKDEHRVAQRVNRLGALGLGALGLGPHGDAPHTLSALISSASATGPPRTRARTPRRTPRGTATRRQLPTPPALSLANKSKAQPWIDFKTIITVGPTQAGNGQCACSIAPSIARLLTCAARPRAIRTFRRRVRT